MSWVFYGSATALRRSTSLPPLQPRPTVSVSLPQSAMPLNTKKRTAQPRWTVIVSFSLSATSACSTKQAHLRLPRTVFEGSSQNARPTSLSLQPQAARLTAIARSWCRVVRKGSTSQPPLQPHPIACVVALVTHAHPHIGTSPRPLRPRPIVSASPLQSAKSLNTKRWAALLLRTVSVSR